MSKRARVSSFLLHRFGSFYRWIELKHGTTTEGAIAAFFLSLSNSGETFICDSVSMTTHKYYTTTTASDTKKLDIFDNRFLLRAQSVEF